MDFLALMVDACGSELGEEDAARCRELVVDVLDAARDNVESLASFRKRLRADARWSATLDSIRASIDAARTTGLQLFSEDNAGEANGFVQSLQHAGSQDIEPAWLEVVSCAGAAIFLKAHSERVLAGEATPAEFRKHLVALYQERFWDLIVSIEDPDVTGDFIVRETARVVPPGSVVSIMGTQNIKGTGLDFVYRWVEFGATVLRLDALERASSAALADELRWMEGQTEMPLLEALECWRRLGRLDVNLRQKAVIERVRVRLARTIEQHWASLDRQAGSAGGESSRWLTLVAAVERMLEPIDAVRRRWTAEKYQRLLVEQRLGHGRAAILMQKLVKRQKGGWLVEKAKQWRD